MITSGDIVEVNFKMRVTDVWNKSVWLERAFVDGEILGVVNAENGQPLYPSVSILVCKKVG